MNEAIKQMLKKYNCKSIQDYENALKEIIQEISLLGLWRSKFFEKAAFYGGSALRIFHKLDRFSEDLDFTLLQNDAHFILEKYNTSIQSELNSFGLDVTINTKNKANNNNIESAFIKACTKKQLILINVPAGEIRKIHHQKTIKVKMEIDVKPAIKFKTEAKLLLQPIPFSVNLLQLPDLFAGKIHALICRNWKNRVKGRDYYDFIWYISHNIPIRAAYLKEKLIQSNVNIKNQQFNIDFIRHMLQDKINHVDFELATKDIEPFIKNQNVLKLWSRDFFQELISRIKTV